MLLIQSVYFQINVVCCFEAAMNKSKKRRLFETAFLNNSRDDKIRTCDPTPPRRVRYRAALHPEILCKSNTFSH